MDINKIPIKVIAEAYKRGLIEDVEVKNGQAVSYKLVGKPRIKVQDSVPKAG